MGVGIRMGNTCKSMADSFQCMTKPTTIKNKIKEKKRKEKKQTHTHTHTHKTSSLRLCLRKTDTPEGDPPD